MKGLSSKDAVGGTLMLVVSLLFLLGARSIDIPVQQAGESMTSRTMPTILASIGIALSLGLVARGTFSGESGKQVEFDPAVARRVVSVIGPILVAIPIFGFALNLIGYFPASILLLLIGQLALGERRPLVLLAGATIAPFFLWLLVDVLLGMSLPMRFFN